MNFLSDLHAQRDALVAANTCGICGKPPTFTTDAGRREFKISGTCEPCFNDLFSGDDEGGAMDMGLGVQA